MRRTATGVLIVALATAVSTALVAWWAVPIATGGWALLRRSRPAVEAALGTGLGWAGLLALTALRGDIGLAAGRLGGVFGLPGAAMIGLTVGFAAMLGGSAALLVDDLARHARMSRHR